MARTASFTTALGTKSWEVTSGRVVDFSGFTTGYEMEAEQNSAIEGSPLSNVRGLKKQTVSFSSALNIYFGIDVRAELESVKEWVGQVGVLKIGDRIYGSNFILTKVKAANTQIDTAGRFLYSKLTFTFEENDEETSASIVVTESATEGVTTSAASVTCSTAKKSLLKSKNTAIQSQIMRRL